MKRRRRFLQPRPAHAPVTRARPGLARVPVADPVSRARRTQRLFMALALLLTLGLMTLDPGSTDTYGFALLAVLAWIGLYVLKQDASLMRLAQRELQRQARTDGLTGLLNRRAFDEHLRVIWRQAEREKAVIGVVLLDVDHFKQINDKLGHPAGDMVLRSVAGVLRTYASRPLDAVGRYGGDEFVVVWYDADAQRFAAMLKLLGAKLNAAMAGTQAEAAGVTMSGGAVICVPHAGMPIRQALEAADKQLYAAKRTSRGKVLVQDLEASVTEASPTASAAEHVAPAPARHSATTR